MENFKHIVSWNVNGLRSILEKNFYDFLQNYTPDILCLQETKIYESVCPKIDAFKYTYFNHCEIKKGYSGTAIFSQIEPLSIRILDVDKEHPEGRIIIAEFKSFFLINTYVPNSKAELQRLPYRIQVWDKALRSILVKLEKTKPILWCGDLNVAHHPIDLENPDSNHFNPGFTDEERQSFSEHLKAGFIAGVPAPTSLSLIPPRCEAITFLKGVPSSSLSSHCPRRSIIPALSCASVA